MDDRLKALALELQEVIERDLGPLERFSHQCHAASIQIVQSGVLGRPARVARGACKRVAGQHSWVVLSGEPGSMYREETLIIDPTLWSYDSSVEGIWLGTLEDGRHYPRGVGSIMHSGCPQSSGGEEIELNWPQHPSQLASYWLNSMFRKNASGPLDRKFWMGLSSGPMEDWPAREFIEAMANTDKLKALIPVDVLGMVTDLNPGKLYLRVEKSVEY